MKRLLALAITCFYFISTQAQSPTLEWVHSTGNTLWDAGENILVDHNDDIIVAGFFSDTVDFDPSSGVLELGTASTTTNNPAQNINGFVQKLDADGELIWAIKNLSGDYTTNNNLALSYTQEMATDDQGNIYIVVPCNNTIDLDPGPNTFTMPMTNDGFALQKLDSNGSFLWALELSAEASKIDIDHNNDIILSGIFSLGLDFDPGPGVFNMYSTYQSSTSTWTNDPFVCKLAGSDGSFIWARQFGANTQDCTITGLGTDNSGNIHLGGAFIGDLNLSYPSTTTILNSQNTTTTDGYYAKLSGSTGNLITYKEYIGPGNYHVRDLELDAANNLYIAGNLIGDAVHKYNPAGIEQWDAIIGTYRINIDISVTDNGTVYIADDFHGTNNDLDPGPNSFMVTSVDTWSNDVIIQLDTNGNFIWGQNTEHIFDTFSEGRFFIAGSNSGDLYVTGTYHGTVDFDYGSGITELTSTPCSVDVCQDIFVQKIGTVCPIAYDTTTVSSCGMYSTSNGIYDVPGVYTILDTLYDDCGIDSILTTQLTLYPDHEIINNVDICEGDSYTLSDGTIITDFPIGPSFPTAYTSIDGCDSIIYMAFIVHSPDTIIIADTICYNSDYTFPDGTTYTGLTEGFIDTSHLSNSYGCDSIIIIDLIVRSNAVTFSPLQLCEGDDYTYADGTSVTNLTSNTNHTSIISNENGCDSTIIELIRVLSLYNVEGDIWICEPFPYQKHIYVDDTATGTNTGDSWNNAFTDLQDALALAATDSEYEIHVAEGIYYPTSGTQRGIAFELPGSTTLLGGYPDNGGTRDPDANETILSGNIDGLPSKDGDSYHVVVIKDVQFITMDGFTIRDGNADQVNSFGRSRGGGVYSKGSHSIVFENCDIKWNRAIYGGGIFLTLCPVVQVNRTEIKNNRADYGSAIFHSNETQLYLEGTRITNNTSDIRAAIEVNNSSHTRLINTVIANNITANSNAISFVATNRDQSCDIYNSTITGEDKNKNLISMLIGFGDQLDINIYNSIIAHQDASFNKGFIAYQNGILNLNTDHCYLSGTSVPGTSNGNLYTGTDGALVLNNDYSLPSNSLGIDAGDDGLIQYYSTDINGTNRILGSAVDMGAFEYSATSSRETSDNDTDKVAIFSTKVYPNPTNDELNIHIEGKEEASVQLDLYNTNGQLLQSKEQEVTSNKVLKMDVSSLPSGIYFLHIKVGHSIHTERVIIQD